VVNYVPFLLRGAKAVPIFVVLSGLLIYRAVSRVEDINDLQRYVIRRTLRVFPVYFSTVLFVIFIMGVPKTPLPVIQYEIGEIFMLRALHFPGFVNPAAWSLYVEILFYAICPIIVATFRGRNLGWLVLGFLVFALGDAAGPRELAVWKYFVCGIIAAEIIDKFKIPEISARILAAIGSIILILDIAETPDWLAAAIMFVCSNQITITGGYDSEHYTLTLGLATILLAVGVARSSLVSSALELPPFRVLGAISYSLFLWHGFLMWADFSVRFDGRGDVKISEQIYIFDPMTYVVIVLPGLLGAAAVSYLVLERPFLIWRRSPAAPLE
jgi:peptidoglycan/LPS O-acetylase OafA/YrhL